MIGNTRIVILLPTFQLANLPTYFAVILYNLPHTARGILEVNALLYKYTNEI